MASEDEVVIDLRKMKIPELKKELQLRELKTSGNKQDLIERLQQYLEEHEGAEVTDDEILKEEGEADDPLIDDNKLEDSVLSAPAEKAKPEEEKKPEEDIPCEDDKKEEQVTNLHSPTGATSISDAEKLKIRAQKFGMTVSDMNVDARKAARSERFGTGGTGSAISSAPGANPDKLKKRSERFGGTVSQTLNKTEEEERRRKRQARFGLESNDTASAGIGDTDKKKKRAERFKITA